MTKLFLGGIFCDFHIHPTVDRPKIERRKFHKNQFTRKFPNNKIMAKVHYNIDKFQKVEFIYRVAPAARLSHALVNFA